MPSDFENDIMQAVRTGLHNAVKEKLTGYNSPLDKLLNDIIANNASDIRALLTEGIGGALKDAEFRESIKVAVRHKLAKTLIEKFGGEMEKQVNLLKSDPATRARITVAIDEIINSK